MTNIKAAFILLLFSFFYTCSLWAKSNNNETERPNIVFIICDDLNDAIHGMGGHPQAKTPGIDKLVAKGVQFTNAQTNCPLCGPSRASLWSGLYPHTTGYFGYEQQKNHWRKNPVLKDAVTIFEHLSGNGYKVYASGKIHHNGHEDKSIFINKNGEDGFKVEASFGPYPWDGDPAKITEKIRGIKHPDFPKSLEKEHWANSFGPIRNLSDELNGKGTWLYTHNGEEYKYINERQRDLMPDERCVEYAKQILQSSHDKPFMITLGFNRPHSPHYVPQKYFDRFPLETLKLAPHLINDLEDCAPAIWEQKDCAATGFHKYDKLKKAGGEELILKWTQAYLACVAFVDEQIDKVVQAVEKSAYADNTLIIVTSDHGYHMGEKEYIFKNSLWEESTRIPLVVYGLNAKKGVECTQPVSLIDIYPTLIDICRLPQNPNQNTNNFPLDGNSLQQLLIQPEAGHWDGNDYALTAIASAEKTEVNSPAESKEQHYSIRTERYRYILCRNGDEELYDHYYDPYEWYNLANDASYFTIKKKLNKHIPYN